VDNYSLLKGHLKRELEAVFSVYPRVYAVALEAAEFLLWATDVGYGTNPSERVGGGIDYAWTREYVPGDTLKGIDWNATAKTGRLMVKEHYLEVEGGVHVVYEPMGLDPVSRDKLAAEFLRTVLSLAEVTNLTSTSITILGEDKVRLEGSHLTPVTSVLAAMRYALEQVGVGFEELYRVLDPQTTSRIHRVFKESGLAKLIEAPPGHIEIPRVLEGESVLLVSGLTGNPVRVLDLAEKARRSHEFFYVVQPTSPWVEASSLRESYRILSHQRKMERILRKEMIVIVDDITAYLDNMNFLAH
jgi:uncharacterized protein (DUF58 family)